MENAACGTEKESSARKRRFSLAKYGVSDYNISDYAKNCARQISIASTGMTEPTRSYVAVCRLSFTLDQMTGIRSR